MIRLIATTLLLSFPCTLGGQTSATLGISKARLQSDAAHGTELSWPDSAKRSKDLGEPDRLALIRAIKAKLRPSMADIDIHTEADMTRVAAETRIKLVDLDGDGVLEVIAQSTGMETCGAVGNCMFWVFKKTAKGYACILDTGSQDFVVEKTRSSGFLDLTLGLHVSASEKHLYVYHFRAGKYREAGCFDADWAPNIDGPALKRPVISECKR